MDNWALGRSPTTLWAHAYKVVSFMSMALAIRKKSLSESSQVKPLSSQACGVLKGHSDSTAFCTRSHLTCR